jgi:hypothetical protein
MSRLPLYPESHFVNRIGWLRAAVLGANDGILSTAHERLGGRRVQGAPGICKDLTRFPQRELTCNLSVTLTNRGSCRAPRERSRRRA